MARHIGSVQKNQCHTTVELSTWLTNGASNKRTSRALLPKISSPGGVSWHWRGAHLDRRPASSAVLTGCSSLLSACAQSKTWAIPQTCGLLNRWSFPLEIVASAYGATAGKPYATGRKMA
jgi:hypothetical protein